MNTVMSETGHGALMHDRDQLASGWKSGAQLRARDEEHPGQLDLGTSKTEHTRRAPGCQTLVDSSLMAWMAPRSPAPGTEWPLLLLAALQSRECRSSPSAAAQHSVLRTCTG